MRRRAFIHTFIAGVLGVPLASGAQQQVAKIARIGFLGANSAFSWANRIDAFRSALHGLGYVEGGNVVIDFRWAEEKYDQLPALAAELVRSEVDVLVTYGTPGTLAAKHATTKIPIVVVHIGDAVTTGVVASLARPGGNITGSTFFVPELMAKRIELLKDAVPRVIQVATLMKRDNPLFGTAALQPLYVAAKSLKVELQQFEVLGPDELEVAFASIAKRSIDAVAILDDAVLIAHARAIADFAAKQRLPSAGFNELAEAGGLIGYGVDFLDLYRRAAVFVDKILKGAKPGDLPVERATKFQLVINLRTAKALGITIPQSLLLRADELIR